MPTIPYPVSIVFEQEGAILRAKPYPSYPSFTDIYDGSLSGGGGTSVGYGRIFGDEFLASSGATYEEAIFYGFPYNLVAAFTGLAGIASGLIDLRAGLYTIKARIGKGDNQGIVSVMMNLTELEADLDLYSEEVDYNFILTYTDVVIPTDGVQALSFIITGKNELSADYKITISKVNFWRTGDLP